MLFRASGSDCWLQANARGPLRRLPRTSACAFYARTASECSAIACGRRRGARRGDELQPAEEGTLMCVRECARALYARAALVCAIHYRLKPKSAHKML